MQKVPEHSNIRTIFFITNHPEPAGAYLGSYWIMSWDGNGAAVCDHEFRGIGQRAFGWHEKDKAEQFLRELIEICPSAKVEYLEGRKGGSSAKGLLGLRRN